MPVSANNDLGLRRLIGQGNALPSEDYARITAESVRAMAQEFIRPAKIISFQGTLSDPAVTPATAISALLSSNQDRVSYIIFQAVTGSFDVVFSQGRTTQEPSNLVMSSAIPAPVQLAWTGAPVYFYIRNSTSGATCQYCILLVCGSV